MSNDSWSPYADFVGTINPTPSTSSSTNQPTPAPAPRTAPPEVVLVQCGPCGFTHVKDSLGCVACALCGRNRNLCGHFVGGGAL